MSSSLSYKPVAPAGELDPVFARFGQRVWPYEKAEELRAENLRRKERNEEIFSKIRFPPFFAVFPSILQIVHIVQIRIFTLQMKTLKISWKNK